MTKQDMKAYLTYAVFMVLCLAIGVSQSCATFNKIVTNDALVSQLATEAATARILSEHPEWKEATITITGDAIKAIDSKVTVDLASVESYVSSHINWSLLMPEEQALVNVLIGQVSKNLEDAFRSQNITNPAAQLVEVRQVLIWIKSAAERQKGE